MTYEVWFLCMCTHANNKDKKTQMVRGKHTRTYSKRHTYILKCAWKITTIHTIVCVCSFILNFIVLYKYTHISIKANP